MPISDIQLVFQWWSVLFLVGVAAFPLTKKLFSGWPATPKPDTLSGEGWYDQGYFFSKAVGFAVVSYIVFLLGTLRIAPFTFSTVIGAIATLFIFGIVLSFWTYKTNRTDKTNKETRFFSFARRGLVKLIICITLEEVVFFGALLLWSWVKAHEPSIRGLEKFMDYGFMQSILNSSYFPAPDMWWQGGFINYYYFGHLVTAVLTRLSGLDLSVTFNLMLATLFALTLTMSFSIGVQLSLIRLIRRIGPIGHIQTLIAGVLTAFLVTFAGNMQTLYAFTKGYVGDNVVPFWTIFWSPFEFFSKVGEGMNRYWYANATRFTPFTIHEFPSYSFVVSDVHGHVLSIPFVLLSIGLLIGLFCHQIDRTHKTYTTNWTIIIFYGFLLGILLMTNALDGPIYLGLFIAILGMSNDKWQMSNWKPLLVSFGVVCLVMVITALPFLIHFKSFATGIGVNCPPEFLANTKIGPFLFEDIEKCQKSPLWMMELLWGFFWFTGIWLFIKRIWGKEEYDAPINRILKVFYIFGLVLIIIPEFFYVKDIYPAHFRSNTMFKLGYEAYILLSIVSGYVICHFVFQRFSPQMSNVKFQMSNKILKFKISNVKKKLRILFFVLLFPQLFLVSIFPIFSVRSYFGELKTYRSIYGFEWLETEYPDDWKAIQWLREKMKEQGSPSTTLRTTMTGLPVIVEADGDSYTDYNHVSAFAGVPTIVGWGVHEWLWRGGYDVVAPRREEVKKIYTSTNKDEIRTILTKYAVRYIIVGKLEREKYPDLVEGYIASIGTALFQSDTTVVYEVKEE